MRISLRDSLSRNGPLFFFFCLILAVGRIGAQSGNAHPGDVQPDPIQKVLKKSLLFPGLGQLYEKQYLKGAVFSGAELFCIIEAVIQNYRGNDAYWKYRMSQTVEDAVEFRGLTERHDRTRNTFIAAGAGVWILNMVDMLLSAKKKFRKKVMLTTSADYEHEWKSVRLGFCFRF